MRVFRHYSDVAAEARGAVVAIGNFDGVHRGHQAVIRRAGAIADEVGAPLAVLTFEPHPRSYFLPHEPAFRLTPLRSKAHALEALGVAFLFVLHFDRAFAAKSAEDFVVEVLGQGLGARHVVVGYDFVFGHRRGGDSRLLGELARAVGFGLTVLDPVADGGEVFSSSRIRELLRLGDPRRAASLLGRWWEIEGRVAGGDRRGHELGYATANLHLDDYLEPALGIYAVHAGLEGEGGDGPRWRDAVASLGRRPTFGGGEVLLEVHVFDFDDDLYGQHLRVRFVEYLREEARFDDLENLRTQIAADCDAARRVLAAVRASGEEGLLRPAPPLRQRLRS